MLVQTDMENTGKPGAASNTADRDSAESKPKRGGKRPGAGRKPNPVKHLLKGVKANTLSQAVQDIDVGAVVVGLLRSKREIIRIQTLNFVFDRILGKPKQDVSVSGGLLHAHTVYRDPLLAGLSDEELQALNAISRKLALPSPDAPQNQAQSDTAIDAVEVASEPKEPVSEASQDGQLEAQTPQETPD